MDFWFWTSRAKFGFAAIGGVDCIGAACAAGLVTVCSSLADTKYAKYFVSYDVACHTECKYMHNCSIVMHIRTSRCCIAASGLKLQRATPTHPFNGTTETSRNKHEGNQKKEGKRRKTNEGSQAKENKQRNSNEGRQTNESKRRKPSKGIRTKEAKQGTPT